MTPKEFAKALVGINDLSCAAIESKPINYDWSQGYTEEGGWDLFEASRCEKCNVPVVGCTGERHSDADSKVECDGRIAEQEGPMMSYYYPLSEDLDTHEAARKLVDLPLCVVTVGDEIGLALTGGGMDLSWQICEAFMVLGYLPPFHFCDLPAMSGRGTSAKDRWIAVGCQKTCTVVADWALRRSGRVQEMMSKARKEARVKEMTKARAKRRTA